MQLLLKQKSTDLHLGVPRGDTPGEGDGDGGPDGGRDRTGARGPTGAAGGTGGTPTAGTGVRPGNASLRRGRHTENTHYYLRTTSVMFDHYVC